jgi:hypothetical protein
MRPKYGKFAIMALREAKMWCERALDAIEKGMSDG